MKYVRYVLFDHVKIVSGNLSTSTPPPFGHATAGVAFEFEVIAIMDKLISLGWTLTLYVTLPIILLVGLVWVVMRGR